MKPLKNHCTIYVEQILDELMELYNFIGKSICQQDEKAFVVYLAEIFAENLPQLKGFSPRNLRRMGDFYKT